MKVQLATHVEQFTESVIREMTRLARQHDAINLAQGFPDFPCPAEIKEVARQAVPTATTGASSWKPWADGMRYNPG